MPNRTLSIPDKDVPLWKRAQKEAARRRQSMSGFVLAALERELAISAELPAKEQGNP